MSRLRQEMAALDRDLAALRGSTRAALEATESHGRCEARVGRGYPGRRCGKPAVQNFHGMNQCAGHVSRAARNPSRSAEDAATISGTSTARAPASVLSRAAKTAPEDTLFVMAQPITPLRNGRDQVTLFAFTPDGIRSRTLERMTGGMASGWSWLHRWGGEALPWSKPASYDGDTPDHARRWHEREHGWYYIANYTTGEK